MKSSTKVVNAYYITKMLGRKSIKFERITALLKEVLKYNDDYYAIRAEGPFDKTGMDILFRYNCVPIVSNFFHFYRKHRVSLRLQ